MTNMHTLVFKKNKIKRPKIVILHYNAYEYGFSIKEESKPTVVRVINVFFHLRITIDLLRDYDFKTDLGSLILSFLDSINIA